MTNIPESPSTSTILNAPDAQRFHGALFIPSDALRSAIPNTLPDSGVIVRVAENAWHMIMDSDGRLGYLTGADLDDLVLLPVPPDGRAGTRDERIRELRRYLHASAPARVGDAPPEMPRVARIDCLEAVTELVRVTRRLRATYRRTGMCLDLLDATAARIDADRVALEALLRGVLGINVDNPGTD